MGRKKQEPVWKPYTFKRVAQELGKSTDAVKNGFFHARKKGSLVYEGFRWVPYGERYIIVKDGDLVEVQGVDGEH